MSDYAMFLLARKDYRCEDCAGEICRGDEHFVQEEYKAETGRQTRRWCLDCVETTTLEELKP